MLQNNSWLGSKEYFFQIKPVENFDSKNRILIRPYCPFLAIG
jgi:hypothetical protein